jgi:hypothetical protein
MQLLFSQREFTTPTFILSANFPVPSYPELPILLHHSTRPLACGQDIVRDFMQVMARWFAQSQTSSHLSARMPGKTSTCTAKVTNNWSRPSEPLRRQEELASLSPLMMRTHAKDDCCLMLSLTERQVLNNL